MSLLRPLSVAAAAFVAACSLQIAVVGSSTAASPDGFTSSQAGAIVERAVDASAGTAASGALRDRAVTANEHRTAVDATLDCLVARGSDLGLDITVRGPRRSPDGFRYEYTFGSAPSEHSAALPDIEHACRAEHLDPVEQAWQATLASRPDVLTTQRGRFDRCMAAAGLHAHLDDEVPAAEVVRRALAAGADVAQLGPCAEASPVLFVAPPEAAGVAP